MARLETFREEYRDVAEFALIYIREAHPSDEWQMESNEDGNVEYEQPKTLDERLELARAFVFEMDVKTQIFVDDIRNTANACYAAWPERIYIIDTDGIIIYKGGMGPFFFDIDDVEDFLRERLDSL